MKDAVQDPANIVWHQHQVTKQTRAKLNAQKPVILWFTGLSGAGKSTVAGAVEQTLAGLGYHTYLLDGDNVRHGLCQDLGFSDQDRRENIRRVGEVAKLMLDAGVIVLTAFISPQQQERDLVRGLVDDDEFIEVFVDAPLSLCEQRDPKGLYKKARQGEIKDFTGIDSPYEAPTSPEIHLHSEPSNLDELVQTCIQELQLRGVIDITTR
ncbi:MAG: adenylyl-sulfate kinase [Vibrio sp.]